MARIQVLELPMRHSGDDTETPFVIILDQLDGTDLAELHRHAALGEELTQRSGARAVIAWAGTLDVA
ncbi:hypothetical protein ABT093_09710 [Kitasatospora sp. NPDC002551]|uniref:hypothetical protein n=1 Tax=Kitasatospora sp. NPDC002551 TaxID=3154539 RepID=UPI00331D67CE